MTPEQSKEWFEQAEKHYPKMQSVGDERYSSQWAEDMYQAFKARLMSEVHVSTLGDLRNNRDVK